MGTIDLKEEKKPVKMNDIEFSDEDVGMDELEEDFSFEEQPIREEIIEKKKPEVFKTQAFQEVINKKVNSGVEAYIQEIDQSVKKNTVPVQKTGELKEVKEEYDEELEEVRETINHEIKEKLCGIDRDDIIIRSKLIDKIKSKLEIDEDLINLLPEGVREENKWMKLGLKELKLVEEIMRQNNNNSAIRKLAEAIYTGTLGLIEKSTEGFFDKEYMDLTGLSAIAKKKDVKNEIHEIVRDYEDVLAQYTDNHLLMLMVVTSRHAFMLNEMNTTKNKAHADVKVLSKVQEIINKNEQKANEINKPRVAHDQPSSSFPIDDSWL